MKSIRHVAIIAVTALTLAQACTSASKKETASNEATGGRSPANAGTVSKVMAFVEAVSTEASHARIQSQVSQYLLMNGVLKAGQSLESILPKSSEEAAALQALKNGVENDGIFRRQIGVNQQTGRSKAVQNLSDAISKSQVSAQNQNFVTYASSLNSNKFQTGFSKKVDAAVSGVTDPEDRATLLLMARHYRRIVKNNPSAEKWVAGIIASFAKTTTITHLGVAGDHSCLATETFDNAAIENEFKTAKGIEAEAIAGKINSVSDLEKSTDRVIAYVTGTSESNVKEERRCPLSSTQCPIFNSDTVGASCITN